MPLPTTLLRSLPPIKRRSLLLPLPLRSLSTQPSPSAPTPSAETETGTGTNPRHPIRTVFIPPSPKPLIRKVEFSPPEGSKPLVRRYESLPSFAFGTGRPVEWEAGDGPLIRKTGAHWSGASPTIRREFNYFAPAEAPAEEEGKNPNRIVIGRKKPDMTAPGHSTLGNEASAEEGAAFRRPNMKPLKPTKLTVEQHRLDRPEIETTWVDTHCHLFTTLKMLKQGSGDTTLPEDGIDSLVKAIFPAQVTAVVDIHCDLPLTNLHEHGASLPWPPHFKYYFSKGVHPHCATDYSDDVHASLIEAMSHPSCVAWGECGLDYFKNDVSTHPIQRAVFARQLTAAVAAGKPIIIHTRAADDDTLRILREHVPRDHRMHVHCFTAGPVLARALMAEWPNAYIGVTGVVGYRDMDHVTGLLESGEIPVGRLLLETDSPYMAPRWAYAWMAAQTPELKKRKFIVSHAGMIPFTAEHALAPINAGRRARGEAEMGLVEMLDVTRGNAARMYGIDV